MREILPAMQTIGTLNPHTLILELPTYSKQRLEKSLAKESDNQPARVYAHELHHWFDILSTLWGQEYIDIVFTAFDAVIGAESQEFAYPQVLKLFDADRRILFPTYYKYVTSGSPHGTTVQWINRWSAGHRIGFDGVIDMTDPILFLRLETENSIVARQPMSVGALLELRAMAAEAAVFNDFLPTMDANERIVEQRLWFREVLRDLYDPQLTTYSAAAHVLASSSGQSGIEPVLKWGAALADICLILDVPTTRKLQPSAQLSALGHRVIHGLRSRANSGFVYACVVSYLRNGGATELDATRLDVALRGVGLPDRSEVYRRAERSLSRREMPNLRSTRLQDMRVALRQAGISILQEKSISFGLINQVSWTELPSPIVMTSDCNQFHLGKPVMGAEDAEWLHDCLLKYYDLLRQALRASRGLDFLFSDFVY